MAYTLQQWEYDQLDAHTDGFDAGDFLEARGWEYIGENVRSGRMWKRRLLSGKYLILPENSAVERERER